MSTLKPEHQQYLNELKIEMPWLFERGDAYAQLRNEFPALSETEAKAIVAQYEATQPKLLLEMDEDMSPCSVEPHYLDENDWNAH